MASPLLTPDLVYRDYKNEDDEPCKALEMRAMQGHASAGRTHAYPTNATHRNQHILLKDVKGIAGMKTIQRYSKH